MDFIGVPAAKQGWVRQCALCYGRGDLEIALRGAKLSAMPMVAMGSALHATCPGSVSHIMFAGSFWGTPSRA
jgi:hypothetical protein